MASTWADSWGTSWATSWTRSSTPPSPAVPRGSYSWTESDYKLNARLKKLALQQARLQDDEEALAILLATLLRR